ncbi:MAG: hypothetical protein WKG00_14400 [Polyangiaceae bacterium]
MRRTRGWASATARAGAWALVALVVSVSAWSCGGKREWVIPRSGEGACMCSAVCACEGINRDAESAKERTRCADACDCDACPGEAPAK